MVVRKKVSSVNFVGQHVWNLRRVLSKEILLSIAGVSTLYGSEAPLHAKAHFVPLPHSGIDFHSCQHSKNQIASGDSAPPNSHCCPTERGRDSMQEAKRTISLSLFWHLDWRANPPCSVDNAVIFRISNCWSVKHATKASWTKLRHFTPGLKISALKYDEGEW